MCRHPPAIRKNREEGRGTSVHRLGDLRGKGNLKAMIKLMLGEGLNTNLNFSGGLEGRVQFVQEKYEYFLKKNIWL